MKRKIISIIGILIMMIIVGGYYFYKGTRGESIGLDSSIVDEDRKQGNTTLDSDKVLVVYFSHGGNTQKLAKEIYDEVGGDFREIKPVVAYPQDDTLYDYTKNEQDNNIRPEIEDMNIDISKYNTVFIGYPVWWYTYPQIVLSFFDKYDLSNKTIVPFVSHGGSGMSGTEENMRAYLSDKNTTVLEGLAVSRNDIAEDQTDTISKWLEKVNFIK